MNIEERVSKLESNQFDTNFGIASLWLIVLLVMLVLAKAIDSHRLKLSPPQPVTEVSK